VLKIGDFSRVAHVTVKTLRHYGRVGLLRPAWVDRFSGYRYYALEQLPRLNRILALKELGFSLEQIAGMLDRSLGVDELRGILSQKRVELEERLRSEQARLTQVEAHLEQIEQAGGWSNYEVVLKSVPAQAVLSAREVIPNPANATLRIDQLRQRLVDDLYDLGLHPSGPWLTLTYNPEYAERNLDLEVAVWVDLAINGGKVARVKPVRILPAVTHMACVVHSGPARDLGLAYGALYAWLDANGWRQAGIVREVCHADPEDAIAACQVRELQMPVEKHPLSKSNTSGLSQKEHSMEPEFVTKPAFMLVGMKYVGKNQLNEISEMWGRFEPFISQLASQPIKATYGWCGMPEEAVEEGAFEYVAAVEANRADNLPDWAVTRMIPANTYAVFPHRGLPEGLKDTYHQAYQVWLPQSGYEAAGPYDMEVYTEVFKGFSSDSVIYIYIPVKKK
jgi:predicted transcriptional regulator YdeE/DNA-binding transcriptional MerR regulator